MPRYKIKILWSIVYYSWKNRVFFLLFERRKTVFIINFILVSLMDAYKFVNVQGNRDVQAGILHSLFSCLFLLPSFILFVMSTEYFPSSIIYEIPVLSFSCSVFYVLHLTRSLSLTPCNCSCTRFRTFLRHFSFNLLHTWRG